MQDHGKMRKSESISFKYHSNTNYNYMRQYDSYSGLMMSLSTYHSELAEAHVQKAGFTAIHQIDSFSSNGEI